MVYFLVMAAALAGSLHGYQDQTAMAERGTPANISALTHHVQILHQRMTDDGLTVHAWISPGSPACAALQEITDGRSIHVLKPEYLTVTAGGKIVQETVASYGCNAYSPLNSALVKKYSQQQFITVYAGVAGMAALTRTALSRQKAVTNLVAQVVQMGGSGIELAFEGFDQWTSSMYTNYKTFVTALAEALHAAGKKLMIDAPAIASAAAQAQYAFKYEDIAQLPVDYITVIVYDYHYDYGVGAPVAPAAWMKSCITWVKQRITDIDKIVIGMPSYGYHGPTGTDDITSDTYEQTKTYPGFSTAQRDPESYEMFWTHNGITYCYQDSLTMNFKRALIASLGIKNISVWHLGGNQWF